jgi:hypothetical protein
VQRRPAPLAEDHTGRGHRAHVDFVCPVAAERSRLTHLAERDDDQVRVRGGDPLEVESPVRSLDRRHVGDEHVGGGRQTTHEVAVVCLDEHAALPRVEVGERRTAFRVRDVGGEGAGVPQGVASRRLELGDFRPEIRQQTCAESGGHIRPAFHHADVLQRSTLCPVLSHHARPPR